MERHREFAEAMYDALNRRDLRAFLERVSEDVEFRSLIAESEGQTFRGHAGVKEWWVKVVEALGGVGFELRQYLEEGDVLVTKVLVRATVGSTAVEQVMWQAVTLLPDGKADWWQTFRTGEEAWSAVRRRRR